MSEGSNDRPEESSPGDERPGPVGGERLAEARRAQQITVLEIAKELHLDELKVLALERNDFDVIGAAVFAKGHLRKYAQLVQVDEGDLMLDYYQLNRSAALPQVVSTRPKPRREASPGPWIAAFMIIFIVGAAYWWYANGRSAPARPVTGEISALPQEDPADMPIETAATNGPGELGDAKETEQAEMETAPLAAIISEPAAAGLRVTLSFIGDCWTEVTDANGRILFRDLGTAGRSIELVGEAPFNVLFGDADNVSVQVNGMPFIIPATERSGRTARLTIFDS